VRICTHLSQLAVATYCITVVVAIGAEADMTSWAEFDDLVATDPKATSAISRSLRCDRLETRFVSGKSML
jgi:hypothetical protein